MTTLAKRLEEKGWSEAEIQQLQKVITEPERGRHKPAFRTRLNPVVYWSTLIVAVIGNFVVAWALLPFLLMLAGGALYFFIAVIALVFGLLFNWLLGSVEHFDPEHHVIAWLFIPALAFITIYVLVGIANQLSVAFASPVRQSPVTVSVVFVAAYVLPYGVSALLKQPRTRAVGRSEQAA